MTTITREMDLLLQCARHPQDATVRAAIQVQVGRGVDWDRLRLLMARHRVTGLVSRSLLEAGVSIPEPVRRDFQGERGRAVVRELRAAAEAARVIGALEQGGVRPLLLKGPGVSLQAFGTLGVRTNRDIDLLVSKAEVAVAAALIESAGYTRVEPGPEADDAAIKRWLVARKDMVYRHPDGHCLELHWRLFDNPSLLSALDPGTRQLVEANGMRFEVMEGRANLLYLCTHGAQHAWSRLKWLADVAALLRRLDGEELEALLDAARAHGVRPSVAQAMLLAERRLGLAIPARVSKLLARDFRARLLLFVADHCLCDGNGRELEDQRHLRLLKNLSHYAIATGARYRRDEIRFDLFDLEAAGLPPSYRRFGMFARLVARFRPPSRKPAG